MSLRHAYLALCLVCGLPLLRADEPAASDAGSFDGTHNRIDALFRGRDSNPALPGDLRNPFSRPDERRPISNPNPADRDPGKQAALSDNALLERVAAAVQVRGIVEASGHPSLIINRKLFDEGDKLMVLFGGAPVEIVIKRITSETFTLGYHDAELTLRLPR